MDTDEENHQGLLSIFEIENGRMTALIRTPYHTHNYRLSAFEYAVLLELGRLLAEVKKLKGDAP